MRLLLAGLLLTLSLPAAAQIYSYTDANGNTVYTDEPAPGSNAQSIDLPPTNGALAPAPSSVPALGNTQQPSNPPASYNAAPAAQPQVIISPNDDAVDEDNGGYDNNTDNDTSRRHEREARRP